ncbi:hypothetical protein ACFYXW_27580 [Streptomyces sp. NPDC001981]|uniref:hypothetical protein n=1 Tax=Streptomyces sp. NPDC001981 TaxID=3364628 RepID=UPI0036C58F2B
MKTFIGVLAGLVLGYVLTWTLTTPPPAPEIPAQTVTVTFNDGFADAKQDDCEQGFEAACEWVMVANDIPLPPK